MGADPNERLQSSKFKRIWRAFKPYGLRNAELSNVKSAFKVCSNGKLFQNAARTLRLIARSEWVIELPRKGFSDSLEKSFDSKL